MVGCQIKWATLSTVVFNRKVCYMMLSATCYRRLSFFVQLYTTKSISLTMRYWYRIGYTVCYVFLASVPVAVSPSLILLHASVSCVRSVTWLWHVAGSGNALVLSCRARSSGGFYCDPDDCGIGAISTCKAHPCDSHKHSGSLRSFHSSHVILPLPGDNQRV